MAISAYQQLFDYCKQGKTQLLLDALTEIEEYNIIDTRNNTLLSCALKNSQWNLATKLIEGEFINSEEPLALIAACQCKGDKTQGISLALGVNPKIDTTNNQKRTALMTACLIGHFQKAQELINLSANCNHQDHYGNTVLMESIQSGNTKLVDLILSKSTGINHANNEQNTAMLIAIKQKNPVEAIIISLLKAGADPEILDNNKKSTWLIAKQKHPKLSRLIEKHLNNINQIELPIFTNDYTLKTEEKTNHSLIASEKKEKKASVNEQIKPITKNNQTIDSNEKIETTKLNQSTNNSKTTVSPFSFNQKTPRKSNKQEWFHAAKIGNLGGLNRMILEGIDINCVDGKGCSALIRACGHSRRAVVSFLLQQNADIELRSHNGSTALSSSIIGNCRRVAGLLLDKGANPNGLGPANYSYATIAAAQWNDAMLSILYRNKADIFIVNKKQQNLLHIVALAAEYYNNINTAKNCLQFLTDHGMNINDQDTEGNTPLMLLCGTHSNKFPVDDRNIASIVHYTLKLGAAPAITNKLRKSAIDATRLHKLQQTKGVLMNALSWNDAE